MVRVGGPEESGSSVGVGFRCSGGRRGRRAAAIHQSDGIAVRCGSSPRHLDVSQIPVQNHVAVPVDTEIHIVRLEVGGRGRVDWVREPDTSGYGLDHALEERGALTLEVALRLGQSCDGRIAVGGVQAKIRLVSDICGGHERSTRITSALKIFVDDCGIQGV